MNPPAIPPIPSHVERPSVRFSLNRWDLIQCRLWVVAHNRFLLGLTLVFSLGIPLLHLRDPGISSRSAGFKLFYVIFFCGLLLAFMAVLQVLIQVLWMFLNKNRGVLGVHELEIRNEGLAERTDVNESMHRWSGFHKISRSRRFLFIFVTDSIVHYVPVRCFPSNEDAKRFQDEIQRRWRAA